MTTHAFKPLAANKMSATMTVVLPKSVHHSIGQSIIHSPFAMLALATAIFCIAFIGAVNLHFGALPIHQVRIGFLTPVVEHHVAQKLAGALSTIGTISPH